MNDLRDRPLEVLIAGGGVAALEAALTLREHAGARVRLTLVARDADFVDRPASVHEAFTGRAARRLPLAQLVREIGAELVRGAIARVVAEDREVVLADGRRLGYDELIVATGAPRVAPYVHALAFRGSQDAEALHAIVEEVESGSIGHVAFVVPPRVAWALPLYELALLTAQRANRPQSPTRISLVTPEPAPLALFGGDAAARVQKLLADAGVELYTRRSAEVPSAGRLLFHPGGEELACDRIVALPLVAGPALPGLPVDGDGFIPVDTHGAVRGTPHVHAAGDATNFPLKQGGLACQQADAAAEDVARLAGAPIVAQPFRPVLRGQLETGRAPHFMRTDLSGRAGDSAESGPHTLWWPPAKVAGERLGPFLAAHRERGAVRRRFVIATQNGPEIVPLESGAR